MVVRELGGEDGPVLTTMLQAQSTEYMRYFVPFAFDLATVTGLLAERERDVYMGLFWEGALAGFFMLRGWDAGYEVPAYGVVIAEQFRGVGLGRLTLELSKTICRLRGARRVMLKVHPDNLIAKRLYEEAGFHQEGIDAHNGNLVYRREI